MFWITGDTHFFEERSIHYQKRPFKTMQDMNEALILRWNNVVRDSDMVFHLGNFGWASPEKLRELVCRLNGFITLIQGEGDRELEECTELGFACVAHSLSLDYKNYHFLLTHNPSTEILYENRTSNFLNLHANSNGKHRALGNRINMACHAWDYTPQRFEDIIMEYRRQRKMYE